MSMRTFIHVITPRSGVKASFHARYLSERERNPEREEPQSRPIFTHDRDGLKHTAAESYLAGDPKAQAKPKDIHHLIIAFNSHDQRELKKLETVHKKDSAQTVHEKDSQSRVHNMDSPESA